MIDKTVLPSGVRVVSERLPYLPSFSLGFWFFVGSRNEGRGEEGLTHFVEHMVFRGTEKRSSFQLSKEIDKRGGILNGFTSREFTCFYVKLLKEFLDVGMDILSDIAQNPVFGEEELEKEKTVVLHEIKSSIETPDDRVFDLFYEGYWKGSSLSHPILGNYDVIKNLTRDRLFDYFRRSFYPGNLVVSISGDVEHEKVVELFERFWSYKGNGTRRKPDVKVSPGVYVETRGIEQVHVVIGFETFSAMEEARYPMFLVNAYLGSGMSSVLFQRVREKLGITYSIYSFYQPYTDTGLFGVYFATSKVHVKKALEEVGRSIGELLEGGVPKDRLREAKDQTKGNIVLALESSENRMGRIAKNEFIYERDVPVEETMEKIEAVGEDDVIGAARATFSGEKMGMAVLGPVDDVDPEELVACLRSGLKG